MKILGSLLMFAILVIHSILPTALGFGTVGLSTSGWTFGCIFMAVYYECWAQEGGA